MFTTAVFCHVTRVFLYLSFTVRYNYMKIGILTPVFFIRHFSLSSSQTESDVFRFP